MRARGVGDRGGSIREGLATPGTWGSSSKQRDRQPCRAEGCWEYSHSQCRLGRLMFRLTSILPPLSLSGSSTYSSFTLRETSTGASVRRGDSSWLQGTARDASLGDHGSDTVDSQLGEAWACPGTGEPGSHLHTWLWLGCKVVSNSCDPMDRAQTSQAPLSTEFSRQQYWSR